MWGPMPKKDCRAACGKVRYAVELDVLGIMMLIGHEIGAGTFTKRCSGKLTLKRNTYCCQLIILKE